MFSLPEDLEVDAQRGRQELADEVQVVGVVQDEQSAALSLQPASQSLKGEGCVVLVAFGQVEFFSQGKQGTEDRDGGGRLRRGHAGCLLCSLVPLLPQATGSRRRQRSIFSSGAIETC